MSLLHEKARLEFQVHPVRNLVFGLCLFMWRRRSAALQWLCWLLCQKNYNTMFDVILHYVECIQKFVHRVIHRQLWLWRASYNFSTKTYFCDSECPDSTLPWREYEFTTLSRAWEFPIKYSSISVSKLLSSAPDVPITWKSKSRVPSSSCY